MGYAAKLAANKKKIVPKYGVVDLGTGNSINISGHSTLKNYYKTLTNSNFWFTIVSCSNTIYFDDTMMDRASLYITAAPTWSYNATTGILTCYDGSMRADISYGSPKQIVSAAIKTRKYCAYVYFV